MVKLAKSACGWCKDAPIPSGVLGGELAPAVLAGPYAVRIARLPPLLQLPPHAHLHATLNVVLEGRYGEAVERGGLQTHGPATLIAKPAGILHRNQLGTAPAECLVIELIPDTRANDSTTTMLFPQEVVQRSAPIAAYAGRLRVELTAGDDLSPFAVEALVEELLAEVARTSVPPPDSGPRWLDRARDLLHEEPGLRSLRDLAARVKLHPIYVARAFRARFGSSVGEYARTLRVERARRLLHHTNLGLCEVAARAGYSDQSHLTRDFRRAFHRSPGSYRKLLRGR
jgi:AraC family transcriptional regulator